MEEHQPTDSISRSAARLWLHLCQQAEAGLMLVRLELVAAAARAASLLITSLILSVGLLFLLLILCVAFALWMGALLHSYVLGTLAAALLWVLMLLLVYMLRHRLITAPLIRQLDSIIPIPSIAPSDDEHAAPCASADDLASRRAQLERLMATGPLQLKLDVQQLYSALRHRLWQLTAVKIISKLAEGIGSLFKR